MRVLDDGRAQGGVAPAVGHLKWGGALETGSECQAQALTLDANEDVYLAGFYEGTCDLDPGPASDVWAASINALHGFLIKLRGTDGTRLWATSTLELNPPTVPRAATVAPDGNVWLAGEYDGTQTTGGRHRRIRELCRKRDVRPEAGG